MESEWEEKNLAIDRSSGRHTKSDFPISFHFVIQSFAYFVYKLQNDTCAGPPYALSCRFRTCDVRRLLTLNSKATNICAVFFENACDSHHAYFCSHICLCGWTSPPANATQIVCITCYCECILRVWLWPNAASACVRKIRWIIEWIWRRSNLQCNFSALFCVCLWCK